LREGMLVPSSKWSPRCAALHFNLGTGSALAVGTAWASA
jgi:hypothetical protein